MIKFSKKVEYALIALLHLDTVRDDSVEPAKNIADQYKIPSDLLGKVLQLLSRPGFVDAVHGSKGGYRLARKLDDIALIEVLEAIDGPVKLTKCDDQPQSCDQYCNCNIRHPIQTVQLHLDDFMRGIKLSTFRKELPTAAETMEV